MPVPVPVNSHNPAHPVYKLHKIAGQPLLKFPYQSSPTQSVFQYVTHNLPRRPTGPPAGFGTREEWLDSLPSWRRNKSRHSCDNQDADLACSRGTTFLHRLIVAT